MTVGLSNSWTSDLSFEISDLFIYVMTYIGGFRISDGRGWFVPYIGLGLCRLQPGPAY